MFRDFKSFALLGFAAALAIGLIAWSASATPTADPCGFWLTANGHGVVEIARCGDALCGRIVGIERESTTPIPTDVHGRPQCGLTIITDEKLAADGTWLGKITDPRNGRTYQAKLSLDEGGNLRLRVFIGISALGATQTWHQFAGHLTSGCAVV